MENEKFWSIPLNEQETTISFGRTDDLADVWTNDRTMITKLITIIVSKWAAQLSAAGS